MALTDKTKVDFSFKILNDKVETSTDKQIYEELRSSHFTIQKSQIWIDEIPPEPSDAVSAGIATKYELFILTEDVTVANKKGWYAFENNEYLVDWISPRFGRKYTVRLYDANNNEITTADPIDWFFQYNPGYLYIQNDHSYSTPFKITGYVYTGRKLEGTGAASDNWKEPVTSENDLPLTGNTQGDVRLTLSENRLYRWDSSTHQWVSLTSAYWIDPVDTYSDLPSSAEDGSIVYVKDLSDSVYGNRLYRWNAAASNWIMVMPGTHFHDDRYYTKAQLDPSASVGNNVLDDRYYTEYELLNGAIDSRYPTHSDLNTYFDKDQGHKHTGVDGEGPRIDFNDLINIPSFGDAHWKAPVDQYINLPVTGNLDGDLRIVLEENVLYRWNASASRWEQISNVQWQERFELVDGQNEINLSHTYTPGKDDILVYINGILGTVNKDYYETDASKITLVLVGENGDRVTVIGKSNSAGYQPKHTYEEKEIDSEEASNDEVVTTSTLLPTTPANQLIEPAFLRANNILMDILVNGKELYDDNYRYIYETSTHTKKIKFSGSGFTGYDLQQNDKIKIKVIKL